MAEQHDVDVLEHAGANVVGLGADQFFGHARPQPDGALQVLALHHLLHRQRGQDVQRHAGVVAFAVARRAFDQSARARPRRASARPAGCRRYREPSEITGLPDPQGRHPRGRNAGDAALDLEALFFQDAGEVFRGFELLEAQFAEAEDAVHHDLRLLLHAVDLAGQIGLHGGFFFGSDFGLCQESEYTQGHEYDDFPHRR